MEEEFAEEVTRELLGEAVGSLTKYYFSNFAMNPRLSGVAR
ncbi:MAG: hypothetical protein R3Y07_07705 [Eubacteriales bacterium]